MIFGPARGLLCHRPCRPQNGMQQGGRRLARDSARGTIQRTGGPDKRNGDLWSMQVDAGASHDKRTLWATSGRSEECTLFRREQNHNGLRSGPSRPKSYFFVVSRVAFHERASVANPFAVNGKVSGCFAQATRVCLTHAIVVATWGAAHGLAAPRACSIAARPGVRSRVRSVSPGWSFDSKKNA